MPFYRDSAGPPYEAEMKQGPRDFEIAEAEYRRYALSLIITEAQGYLNSTDAKVVRSVETGESLFEDVRAARQKARETITNARKELAQLEAI